MNNYTEWCRVLHTTLSANTEKSKRSTKMIKQSEIDAYSLIRRHERFDYYTLNTSIIETLQRLPEDSGKVGILNCMAYTNPGEDWSNGCMTQEALLCSCSTLFPCLSQYADDFFYENRSRLHDGLFTSDCLFTNSCHFYDVGDMLWSKEVSVLSIAMPVNSKKVEDMYDLILLQRTRDAAKVFNMFECDSIIIECRGKDAVDIMPYWMSVLTNCKGLFKRLYILQD